MLFWILGSKVPKIERKIVGFSFFGLKNARNVKRKCLKGFENVQKLLKTWFSPLEKVKGQFSDSKLSKKIAKIASPRPELGGRARVVRL